MIGKHKLELDTPCLVIDKNKLMNNIETMQAFATAKSKQVRPHAKTHKCVEICQLQLDAGSIGISITKPSEAYELAKAKIRHLLITSPIVTKHKLATLAKILKLAPETMLVVDSNANLTQLNQLGCELNLSINLLIDIDAGIGRTGASFEAAFGLALAVHQHSNTVLKGIQCYAGHFQHIVDNDERKQASAALLNKAGKLKQDIEHATGLVNLIQSGSGTGTYQIDSDIASVTEIQPGSYSVMDQEYFDIEYSVGNSADNSVGHFQPAMTLLTSVISANHSTHVTVDAGTKALYKETTHPQIISHDGLKYEWHYFGDEHGKVSGDNLPNVGGMIEMIVPHCDPTINLHDKFYVVEDDIVVEVWDIALRGKLA
ncbi:DSD1 family PLP-dependent enzyme [Moritella dasanensis]|uniref:DSD1 family PLP-dependent enzyme n=1 Tax=Moritella dasanensis TaxID=428031 RepID=UPI0002EA1504|nr:DSD1 family PLP-dependent enzyme [Moritella dasanensis]